MLSEQGEGMTGIEVNAEDIASGLYLIFSNIGGSYLESDRVCHFQLNKMILLEGIYFVLDEMLRGMSGQNEKIALDIYCWGSGNWYYVIRNDLDWDKIMIGDYRLEIDCRGEFMSMRLMSRTRSSMIVLDVRKKGFNWLGDCIIYSYN